MKAQNRSWRTALIAWVGVALLAASFLLVVFEKATLSEFIALSGAIGALMSIFMGFFSKDAKATHSGKIEQELQELKHELQPRSIGGDQPPEDKKNEKKP